jgi:plasmid stability protein
MASSARATVYLDTRVHRAAKIKAAASGRSFSDVVDEALRQLLKEDAIDLAAFDTRARQSTRPFEDVVKALKRDGLI